MVVDPISLGLTAAGTAGAWVTVRQAHKASKAKKEKAKAKANQHETIQPNHPPLQQYNTVNIAVQNGGRLYYCADGDPTFYSETINTVPVYASSQPQPSIWGQPVTNASPIMGTYQQALPAPMPQRPTIQSVYSLGSNVSSRSSSPDGYAYAQRQIEAAPPQYLVPYYGSGYQSFEEPVGKHHIRRWKN